MSIFFVSICITGLVSEIYLRSTMTKSELLFWNDGLVAGIIRRQPTRLLLPNLSLAHELQDRNGLIFRAEYHSNSLGLRSVPTQHKDDAHLLLFGCSYLFGVGVNDNQNIPYFLSQQLLPYHPYVFAISAGSMSNMLAILQTVPIEAQVTPSNGILLYLLYPEIHTNRAVGFRHNPWFGFDNPYYTWNSRENKLQFQGSFRSAWQIFFKVLEFLQVHSKLALKISDLVRADNTLEDYVFAMRIILASKEIYLKKFPNGRFIVATMTHNSPLNELLRGKNIELWYLPPVPDQDNYYIKGDGHYSPEGNRFVADSIAQELRRRTSSQ